MSNASTAHSLAAKAKPEYPFVAPPEYGHSIEVAPGVRWMRMPLPFAPDHINVWAIRDGEGWALVDSGMCTDDTTETWRELFANGLDGLPLTRIFATHMHQDHIGMAGWLCRKFDIRLWMTQLEYLSCRVIASDTGRAAPQDGIDFYRRAGWPAAAIENYRARFGHFGKYIHALPDSYRRLRDGEEIRIGHHAWRVVVGTGHSPEHASLHCPALKLLISGDQVLPTISSNVSVHPTEPDANPVADWLTSLAKIRREVADDVLVLPAHGKCFHGLHARIDALDEGLNQAIDRLRLALAEPKRVVDVLSALFSRSIGETELFLLGMASGEAIACLNYLLNRGEAGREIDANGIAWYRLISAP